MQALGLVCEPDVLARPGRITSGCNPPGLDAVHTLDNLHILHQRLHAVRGQHDVIVCHDAIIPVLERLTDHMVVVIAKVARLAVNLKKSLVVADHRLRAAQIDRALWCVLFDGLQQHRQAFAMHGRDTDGDQSSSPSSYSPSSISPSCSPVLGPPTTHASQVRLAAHLKSKISQ